MPTTTTTQHTTYKSPDNPHLNPAFHRMNMPSSVRIDLRDQKNPFPTQTPTPAPSPPNTSPTIPSFRSRPGHIRVSSLHQRAFHSEPYPPSATSLSPTSPFSRIPPSTKYEHPVFNLLSLSDLKLPPLPRSLGPLTLYFTLNLLLTLYNKLVLVRFPFPYTLTALHALAGTLGAFIFVHSPFTLLAQFIPPQLSKSNPFTQSPKSTLISTDPDVPLTSTRLSLTRRETAVVVAFSVLYAVNIVVSNVSLGLVTVPFHQVVRASTPLFTIIFSASLLGQQSSRRKIISLFPVVAGVGFATYGDYYFTPWGFLLTLLGTLLAALKTIITNVLQSPPPSLPQLSPSSTLPPPSPIHSKSPTYPNPPPANGHTHPIPQPQRPRHPLDILRIRPLHHLDLLLLTSPLAFIQCVLIAHFTGELDRVRHYSQHEMTPSKALALLANGAIAFGLNVVSFSANRKVGALSMTVAGNVKQVLTVLIAVVIFDLTITSTNALGILLTLVGGAWYAQVEYEEKRGRRRVA